jgi:hypothetical protein
MKKGAKLSVRLSIPVDGELNEILRIIAYRKSQTVQALVSDCIKEHLKEQIDLVSQAIGSISIE